MSEAELKVILSLCAKVPAGDDLAVVTTSDLADRTGLAQRTVFAALRTLEESGCIRRHRQPDGPFAAGIQIIAFAALTDASQQNSSEPDRARPATGTTDMAVLAAGEETGLPNKNGECTDLVDLASLNDFNELAPLNVVEPDQAESAAAECEAVAAADAAAFQAVERAYRRVTQQELRQLREIASHEDLVTWMQSLYLHGGVDPTTPLGDLIAALARYPRTTRA